MAARRRNDQYVLDVNVVDPKGRVISVLELAAIGGGIEADPMAVEEANYAAAERAVPLEEEVGPQARTLGQPKLPTQEERDIHNLTHVPYAAWCEDCVRAPDKEGIHVEQESVVDSLQPIIQFDYFFLSGEDK